MPYPETCPECGGPFRNTGTHFTARRNEINRHVLLELGCQATSRRFWWDFTQGVVTGDGKTPAAAEATSRRVEAELATVAHLNGQSNGHVEVAGTEPADVIEPPSASAASPARPAPPVRPSGGERLETGGAPALEAAPPPVESAPFSVEDEALPVGLRAAFLRQLELDRLTMRQMRSWLLSEEARRAAEVAVSATEATYERLALTLFGMPLPRLLGQSAAVPSSSTLTADEKLELQREKARIRARQRRAAQRAARQVASGSPEA